MPNRHAILRGASLSLGLCDTERATIIANPSLRGEVVLAMQADAPEELGRIVVSQGAVACIEQRPRPEQAPTGWRPTLQVDIAVPPGFALDLAGSNLVVMQVGAVGGRLTAAFSSGARLQAEDGIDPDVSVASSADVDIKAVLGRATLVAAGGQIRLRGGELSRLQAQASDSAGIHHGGRVLMLEAVASGYGAIEIADVQGRAELMASGSGRITLLAASIERLTAVASGSGKVSIQGRVARGDAIASSSGRIEVASAPAGAIGATVSSSGRVVIGDDADGR